MYLSSNFVPNFYPPDNLLNILIIINNRRANQRILELENQLTESLVGSTQHESPTASSIKNQMAQLQTQLQQLTTDKEQKISQLEAKEAQVTDLSESTLPAAVIKVANFL